MSVDVILVVRAQEDKRGAGGGSSSSSVLCVSAPPREDDTSRQLHWARQRRCTCDVQCPWHCLSCTTLVCDDTSRQLQRARQRCWPYGVYSVCLVYLMSVYGCIVCCTHGKWQLNGHCWRCLCLSGNILLLKFCTYKGWPEEMLRWCHIGGFKVRTFDVEHRPAPIFRCNCQPGSFFHQLRWMQIL